jgi:hypothetical protein
MARGRPIAVRTWTRTFAFITEHASLRAAGIKVVIAAFTIKLRRRAS